MLLVAGIFSVCLMSCWAYIWSDPLIVGNVEYDVLGRAGSPSGIWCDLVYLVVSHTSEPTVFSFGCARFVTPRCLLYVFIGHTF